KYEVCGQGMMCNALERACTQMVSGGSLTISDNPDQPATAGLGECFASFLFTMDNVEDGVLNDVAFVSPYDGELFQGYAALYVGDTKVDSGWIYSKFDSETNTYVDNVVAFEGLNITLLKGKSTT